MSDSFATAPRLDSTTLTLRIYPKPPTTHTILRSLLLLPFLRHRLTPLLLPLARSHPTPYLDQPTTTSPCLTLSLSLVLTPVSPVRLPACGACFPIPHSTLVVARTPREKVTSRSRVSQDPANPSWYKIAPSGSQHRRRSRNAADERRREIGIPKIETTQYRRG